MPVINIIVGPLAGSAGAVRFSVGPHEPIRDIRSACKSAIFETIGGRFKSVDDSDFIPHISIAYNSEDCDAMQTIGAVEKVRHHGSIMAQISAVELVELRREDRSYAYEVLERVPLAHH
ncbi:hypothetical protein L3i22_061490 [Actinoplanes sp. L3-i22]|nr:hypothetical protein L3i22_061490 [Actinoplanes sp. L3-i22]